MCYCYQNKCDENYLDIDFLLRNVTNIVNSVFNRVFTGSPSYPIDLKTIARDFNIPIYEEDFKPEIAGVFIIESGAGAICINQNDLELTRRFTIAHELGHFISAKLQNKSMKIYDKREHLVCMTIDKEEKFANHFSAELLMPEAIFAKQIKLHENNRNWPDILASYFYVSRQAINIRVRTLSKQYWVDSLAS